MNILRFFLYNLNLYFLVFTGFFKNFTGIFNIEECHASGAICAHHLLENVSVFFNIFVNRMKYRQKKNIELKFSDGGVARLSVLYQAS